MIFSLWAARSLSAARRLTGSPSPTAENHSRATFYASRTTKSPFLTMDNHPRKTLPSSPTTFGAERSLSAARRLTGSPSPDSENPSRAKISTSLLNEFQKLTRVSKERRMYPIERKNS